jgi:hypothetical protein
MNPMKGLRKAAFGLAVVACLLTAAPAAQAGVMDTPLMLVSHGGRIAGWVARIAGWFEWGGEQRRVAASGGSGRRVPLPAPQGDCTGGMDPNGGPCKP